MNNVQLFWAKAQNTHVNTNQLSLCKRLLHKFKLVQNLEYKRCPAKSL